MEKALKPEILNEDKTTVFHMAVSQVRVDLPLYDIHRIAECLGLLHFGFNPVAPVDNRGMILFSYICADGL